MKYKVEYTKQAVKQLKKLDKPTASLIIGWIEKNLVECENPRQYGKGLVANHRSEWRYRIGNYRLIADIQDEKITILILNVGHRREIYKK
ncbi:MAG: type II toxin-antitoxin system RelE/ParE family toxin [Ruminococcus sp.]|nr:type II toxin-antitoxin system RelE/ParE family toxin [Ruminococcus sp.]